MNYAPKASKAYELVLKYGATMTATRAGSTTDWEKRYDQAQMRYRWYYIGSTVPAPTSPVDTAPTGSPTIVSGVAVQTAWDTRALSAGTVVLGDIKLIIQAPSEILECDVISFNGNTYNACQPITKVQPDGTTIIIQEVNCRG